MGFLSRLPLPQGWFSQNTESLTHTARAFPVAGGILGALAGVALICSSKAGLPPQAAALIAIASLAVMTGALHEDGLGDTADGFFGGSTHERRLEIMKDSHIGTFSALTLIVVIGLKTILLASIIERSNACYAAFALIGIEAASRAAMVMFWQKLPSARPGGLADRAGTPDQSASRFSLILGASLLALTFIPIGGFGAVLIGTLLSAAVLFGFAKLCIQKIDGQTGDTLGAAQQITTLTLLASLVMTL